jgi:hypothetical protein
MQMPPQIHHHHPHFYRDIGMVMICEKRQLVVGEDRSYSVLQPAPLVISAESLDDA